MIRALMELALNERVIVIGVALALLIAGAYSFAEIDIEAYPDPVQPMVEVLTLPSGLSAEEVEKLVTVPLEVGLAGMRDLQAMRSISLFGLSDVRCYFAWDSDYYQDRVETINQLGFIRLPQGVVAGISPENPIGEIYRYTDRKPGSRPDRGKGDRGLGAREAAQDGAGRDRRFGLRRADQGISRRCRPAETQLLSSPALDADQLDIEFQYQRRRQLPDGRRAGLRRARVSGSSIRSTTSATSCCRPTNPPRSR